jgi:hypothetical protein
MVNDIIIKDPTTGIPVNSSKGNLHVMNFGTLVPEEYDYIALSYTGDNLTEVVYKVGGSTGTTMATLTLAYTGSVLDTVTKT